ncbi:hypothetical protein ARMSODRAFT_1083112 [Armillaria solidipes]|uniref:Uncharacterized protein n=2 Tax=Armillaria TaxID=47424 RepID=A0A2H3C8R8_9AGAR|nr:hypothetical protein EV421DRAFT_1850638 [Armillaria borealis]PBK71686.1 hypothetical protein ARMSODRAFT_1083112 [Armillaria solidipes]
MLTEIPLDKASFIGLVLETLNYGVFNVLFLGILWLLWNKRSLRAYAHRVLFVTACLLWILTTLHWIINVCRATIAFVERQGEVNGALAYYADLTVDLYAAKTAVYVALTLVGDSFVTYRCWIIWSQKIVVVILPMFLVTGTAVTGFVATHKFTLVNPGSEIFLPNLVPWVTSFIVLSLVTNVVCTFLIAFRLIQSHRSVAPYSQSKRLISTLIIIVESAAIYSSALTALVTLYVLGSNGQYVALDMTAPIIGITFSMIIIRVALTKVRKPGYSTNSSSGLGGQSSDVRYPVNSGPITVNVSRLVEMNRDDALERGDSKGVPSDNIA